MEVAKASGKTEKKGPATIQNRRAGYDYEILETYEAGLVLVGSEVKSLYAGRANLGESFARIEDGEVFLYGMDIEPYEKTSAYVPDRRRTRKLLLNRNEIELLYRKATEKGLSIIPLRIYFKERKAKVLIGIARGKKSYDKRDSIKEKDERRSQLRGDD